MSPPDERHHVATFFDWDAFRATPLTLPIDHLAQCSALGLDTYTLQLAKHLCNQYPIALSRKRELAQAFTALRPNIENLPISDNKLHSLAKFIVNLSNSEESLALLCVCNVLGAYYPSESIVAIFFKLVKQAGVPEDLKPTEQAWESLTPLFENLQGQPMFAALVNKYTALGDLDSEDPDRPLLNHCGAGGVIEILEAISRHARDKELWTQLVAGKEAGWSAAVSEWLFEVNFELHPSLREERIHGEKVLHSSYGEDEKVQFVIRFNPPGVPVGREPIVDTPLMVKVKE